MEKWILKKNLTKEIKFWHLMLEEMLKVESYKTFFSITSTHEPIVVENKLIEGLNSDKDDCHGNVKSAVDKMKGEMLSGWIVINEFIFENCPVGICRLVHHCNLKLKNEKILNITKDNYETPFHIFIRDDKRKFNFDKNEGYNDRMIFADHLKHENKNIPRNKVFFCAEDYFDRDLYFEKFTIHKNKEELSKLIPHNLNDKDRLKWIMLKSKVSIIKNH
jgi:hypothetical protein